jgi:TrmH family RNA methyltransferase
MSALRSRENPRVKRWAKLARDARLRRRECRALIEGAHLLAAFLDGGGMPLALVVSETTTQEISGLVKKLGVEPIVVSDAVLRAIADTDAPQGVLAEIAIPGARETEGDLVFLEGVQDPGNVGAIIRSAAAFGIGAVVLDQACADPWSPKVLRAGLGGHFRLFIRQVAGLTPELAAFRGTLVSTAAHGGLQLENAALDGRLGWIFGAEGRGISEQSARHAKLQVAIPMAAGMESLNVAAAAAICLYRGFSKR